MRHWVRRFAALAGALGALVAPSAFAAWDSTQAVVLSQRTTSRVGIDQGSELSRLLTGRSYVPGSSSGEVLLQDLLNGPGPKAGETVAITAARSVAWATTGRAVARALPLIGNAIAVAQLLNSVRCLYSDSAGATCDDGQPQQNLGQWGYYDGGDSSVSGYRQSADSAASFYAAQRTAANSTAGCTTPGKQVYTVAGGGTKVASSPERWQYTVNRQCSNGGSITPLTVRVQNYGTALQCPSFFVGGVEVVPVQGPDGLCPTNVYASEGTTSIGDKLASYGDKSKAISVVPLLDGANQPLATSDPTLSGPASVQGDRQVITKPDGSKTVKDTSWPISYEPGGYSWVPQEQDTDYSPGAAIPPQGAASGGTITTGSTAPVDINTCGLPGKPPCKIDETGTPVVAAADGNADANAKSHDWKTCLTTPSSCLPTLPSLAWSFSLPSGCTPLVLGYGPIVGTVTIDMCAYQPQIHDLMSMIWAAAGLFGALGLMFRDSAGSG